MTKRDKVSWYPTNPPSCGEQWVFSSSLLYLRCHWAVTGMECLGNIWLTEKCDRGLLRCRGERRDTCTAEQR